MAANCDVVKSVSCFSYFPLDLTLTVKFMISHAQQKHKEESYESDKRQVSERLSETSHFKNVILFTLPTIAMSLFMSFYTMVDGLFVSRLIGTNALSAINLTAPCYFPGHCCFYHAGYRRQRCYHEKMGERKKQKPDRILPVLYL